MFKKIILPGILLLSLLISCSSEDHNFRSEWDQTPDQIWVGPEYWANRLQDWEIKGGRLECKAAEFRLPLRTIHLLNRRIGSNKGNVNVSVNSGLIHKSDSLAADAASGFLIGAGGSIDYRAASLIHHSYGNGAGLFAGFTSKGSLFIKDLNNDNKILEHKQTSFKNIENFNLKLELLANGDAYDLKLSINENQDSDFILVENIDEALLLGNIALVSHSGTEGEAARFWYKEFKISGDKLDHFEDRNCGPVISAQHTLSKGILKLTAQLMPLGKDQDGEVLLQTKSDQGWQTISKSIMDPNSYTATFKVTEWNTSIETAYRLVSNLKRTDNQKQEYYYEGKIRKDPIDKDNITIAAFTGNHNVVRPNPRKWGGVDVGKFPWTWGVWFPHQDMISSIKKHQADVLFFSGDQVYEGASPTFADRKNLRLDYLYKWYLWCWAYGELTKEIPAVTIPDDHDVYHGNIWGAGGVFAKNQDDGGYKFSPEFVNMVERTQTSHLPDPFDPSPVAQGIGVYYTDLNYGGISFAILEDRKFKSAPKPSLPKGKIVNGWSSNKKWDPKTESDLKGLTLLGNRQLDFLESWSSDWSHKTWMKVVLSQTIFSNVATLPAGSLNGSVIPGLAILDKDAYAENDEPVADMDSNGWPKTGRDKALRAIRKSFAFHIAGDQHLGSTIQYGVDDYQDAGFALCVPSVANFWPRRWFPSKEGKNHIEGMPKYTGDYEDGFGNKMTVHAVSNPSISNKEPKMLHDMATGYGIVNFNKPDREITIANWPRWADPEKDEPYNGWPIVINQLDNYGRKVIGSLPKLSIEGTSNAVVQLIKESTGEIIYTLRLKSNSFQAKVFEQGKYTVRMGDPDSNTWEVFKGLEIQ